MKQMPCFVFYALFLTLGGKSAAQEKRALPNPYNSFASDLNTCLFNDWAGVLETPGACNEEGDVQLCYGRHNLNKALFAVCFNKLTRIPKFTANVYKKGGTEGEENMIGNQECYEDAWKIESGSGFTPADQATNNDYDDERQKALLGADRFSGIENRFLGKGHLTPDGDFKKDENCEKSFTYIYTNAAPQWQLFNAGNWAALEGAIRSYTDRPTVPPVNTRTLYIFTGTGGGAAQYNGANIGRLNNKIEVPRYYWKAVCDPQAKQSIVFVAENTPGITDPTAVNGCPLTYHKQGQTYNNKPQQRNMGVIQCSSVNDAKAAHPLFKLPTFNPAVCGPQNVRGNFLDQYLADKLK